VRGLALHAGGCGARARGGDGARIRGHARRGAAVLRRALRARGHRGVRVRLPRLRRQRRDAAPARRSLASARGLARGARVRAHPRRSRRLTRRAPRQLAGRRSCADHRRGRWRGGGRRRAGAAGRHERRGRSDALRCRLALAPLVQRLGRNGARGPGPRSRSSSRPTAPTETPWSRTRCSRSTTTIPRRARPRWPRSSWPRSSPRASAAWETRSRRGMPRNPSCRDYPGRVSPSWPTLREFAAAGLARGGRRQCERVSS